MRRDAVLLVVDLQNDFLPGGALAVERGDEVIPVINRVAPRFENVLLTQDWHPPGHISFASSHAGQAPFSTIELEYGRQVLWPDHCIQGTHGAAFADALDVPHAQGVIRKGYHSNTDSYSAFLEADRHTPTGLTGLMNERGLRTVYLAGLALDFCVAWSALDARLRGFEAIVIDDACRPIDAGGSLVAARKAFADAFVRVVTADSLR